MRLNDALKVSAVEHKLDGVVRNVGAVLPYEEQDKCILATGGSVEHFVVVWKNSLAPVRRQSHFINPITKVEITWDLLCSEDWEAI